MQEEVKDSGVTDLTTAVNTQQHFPTPEIKLRPSIYLLIHAHVGMASTLHNRIFSALSHKTELSIYTKVPYARRRATLQPLFQDDTVLCLVGGIGVTNAL